MGQGQIRTVDQAVPAVDQDFASAHQALKADPAIQFNLTPAPPPPQPPQWLKDFVEWLGEVLKPVERFFNWIGGFMPDAPYARILLWTVLAVAAVALAGADLPCACATASGGCRWRAATGRSRSRPRRRSGRRRRRRRAPGCDEADALAAKGRYAEAIHHLLFRSIEDIARRRPRLVRPALTSRELAGVRRRCPPRGPRACSRASPAGRAQPVRRPRGRRRRLDRGARRLCRLRPARGLAGMSDVAHRRRAHAAKARSAAATMLLIVAVGIARLRRACWCSAPMRPTCGPARTAAPTLCPTPRPASAGSSGWPQATGRNPQIVAPRVSARQRGSGRPDAGERRDRPDRGARRARATKATLVVLPKWDSQRDPQEAGAGCASRGLLPALRAGEACSRPTISSRSAAPQDGGADAGDGAGSCAAAMRFPAPPVAADGRRRRAAADRDRRDGRIVLGQFGDRPLYVLADPDLLNNHGMADRAPGRGGAGAARFPQQHRRGSRLCSTSP